MKKISIVFIVIFLALESGCSLFPDGTNQNIENVSVDVNQDEQGNVQGSLSDKVRLEATVSIPENVQWKKYTAKFREYNQEIADEISRCFSFAGSEVSKNNYAMTGPYFPDGKTYVYGYSNGGTMTISPYSIDYFTNKQKKNQYPMFVTKTKENNLDLKELFPKEELQDYSKDDAINTVKELCEKLNVNIGNTPEIYALDSEKANEMKKSDKSLNLDKNENELDDWGIDDEVYYMVFHIEMDGIELSTTSAQSDSSAVTKALLEAYVSREGIEKINITGLFDIQDEEEIKEDVCSLDTVYQVVAADYYYSAGLTGDISVTDIRMVYVPTLKTSTSTIEIKPVYVCTIKTVSTSEKTNDVGETVSTEFTKYKYLYIDAVTGQTVLN